jgi:hypothetical protein
LNTGVFWSTVPLNMTFNFGISTPRVGELRAPSWTL